jgi:hypothetical protein
MKIAFRPISVTLVLATVSFVVLASCQTSFAAEVAAAESSASAILPDNVTSAATQLPSSGSLLDNFYLNYFATFHGSALGNLRNSESISRTGTPSTTQGQYLDSEVTTAYMITKNFGIGPDIPFQIYGVKGEGVTLGDVGAKIVDFHTVDYNGLKINTNFYVQAPTSTYSQSRNLRYGLKSTPSVRYDFKASRFAIGSWNEIKDYVGVTSGAAFKLYALPYVSYQMTPTLSAVVGYEMETHHNVGDIGTSFSSYETDLQPGVSWMITPKVIFNPYVQIFTGNNITWDSTAVGAVISATVL